MDNYEETRKYPLAYLSSEDPEVIADTKLMVEEATAKKVDPASSTAGRASAHSDPDSDSDSDAEPSGSEAESDQGFASEDDTSTPATTSKKQKKKKNKRKATIVDKVRPSDACYFFFRSH